jgi:hypothetical protein
MAATVSIPPLGRMPLIDYIGEPHVHIGILLSVLYRMSRIKSLVKFLFLSLRIRSLRLSHGPIANGVEALVLVEVEAIIHRISVTNVSNIVDNTFLMPRYSKLFEKNKLLRIRRCSVSINILLISQKIPISLS